MKLSLRNIIGIIILSVLICCSRSGIPLNDDPHVINTNDTIPPVIVIAKPQPDQVFLTGETITVEGKVTDKALYRGKIQIINAGDNAIVNEQAYEIHGLLEYSFNYSYKTTVSTSTNYIVSVSFEDHGLNVTTKVVNVKVNP